MTTFTPLIILNQLLDPYQPISSIIRQIVSTTNNSRFYFQTSSVKFLFTFLFFNFLFLSVHAQIDREQQPSSDMPGFQIKSNRLYGKLIDNKTGKPVEAASVQLFLADNDSIVSGMLSKPNGDFSFSEIPAEKNLKVVITAIGYEPLEQVIEISPGKQNRSVKIDKDLGNIELEANVQVLGGVTVVSNKPVLE